MEAFFEHGAGVFFVRVSSFLLAKARMLAASSNLQHHKWDELRDSQKGNTLFIIGNGPSLNLTPLYLLEDEHTFCCNSFHLMSGRLSWRPTYYIVTDDLVVRDLKEEFPAILSEVGKAFFPYIHTSNTNFYEYLPDSSAIYWLDVTRPSFSRALPQCGINNTVLNAAIQVGAYMGYSKICMLGVDLQYDDQPVEKETSRDWVSTADDPNHFDDRYFGEGKRFHDPQPLKMLKKFKEAKDFYGDAIEFVNCGVGGNLNAYPRQGLMEAVGLDECSFLDRFLREISIDIDREKVVQFSRSSELTLELHDGGMLKKLYDAALVKKYLKSHTVKGPFKGIFFLKPLG